MTENFRVFVSALGIVSTLVLGFVPQLDSVRDKLEHVNAKLEQFESNPVKLSGWYETIDEKSSISVQKGPVLHFLSSMFKVPHIWTEMNIKDAFSFADGVDPPRYSKIVVKKNRVLNLERAGQVNKFSGELLNARIESAIQDWRAEIKKLPEPIQEKASLYTPYILFGLAFIGVYALFLIKKIGKGIMISLLSAGAWYLLALVSLTLGRHETFAEIPFSYVGIALLLGVILYRLPIPMYSSFFIKLGVLLLGIQWAVHQFPMPNEALEIVLYQGAFGSILTGIASWVLVLGSLSLAKRLIFLFKKQTH
jgi:hypothetical protein